MEQLNFSSSLYACASLPTLSSRWYKDEQEILKCSGNQSKTGTGSLMAIEQEKTFKEWLGEYKQLIFKVVRVYAVNREDADDLFQEILLGLWSSIPRYENRAKEATWIYRVALNTALVWRRGESRKKRRDKKIISSLERIAESANENRDGQEREQVIEQVYGAIRKLEKIDSSIVLMWLDGLSYEQIAGVIGISKSNVGVKLNRAKKKLAQLLKGPIDDV